MAETRVELAQEISKVHVRNLFDLRGKVALVTGGRRGLGRAMVLGLAEAGVRVAVIARSPEAPELTRDVAERGGEILYLSADLAKPGDRVGLIDRVVDHFGQLDILVNNAGAHGRIPALDYPLSQWNFDLELLLTSVLDLSQQAARVMIPQGGGKIIQIASINSFQGARQIVGYSTAKHGLVGLVKCLANEWAPQGININAIAPGLFETDLTASVFADPRQSSELRGRIPAGRFGKPEDVVGPLLFLASEASLHVHGHVLVVDGGWMGR